MYHKVIIIHNGKHNIEKDLDTGKLYLYQNDNKFLLDKQNTLSIIKTRPIVYYVPPPYEPIDRYHEEFYELTIDNPFTDEQIDQIHEIFKKDVELTNHLNTITMLCLLLTFIFFVFVFYLFVPSYDHYFIHGLLVLFLAALITIPLYCSIYIDNSSLDTEQGTYIQDFARSYEL